MPSPQVIGIGEALIDFIGVEHTSLDKAATFKKCFGGAPMNTIVGVAEKALKYGIRIVGVKLGAHGSFLKARGGTETYVPAFKVKAVDATGAGDGWNAGLLVGLCKGLDVEQCAKVANAVGALVVTKPGAITALPSREELNRFLKANNVKISI